MQASSLTEPTIQRADHGVHDPARAAWVTFIVLFLIGFCLIRAAVAGGHFDDPALAGNGIARGVGAGIACLAIGSLGRRFRRSPFAGFVGVSLLVAGLGHYGQLSQGLL